MARFVSYGAIESKVVPRLVATVQPILSQNATDVVVKRQYFGCSLILMQDRLDGRPQASCMLIKSVVLIGNQANPMQGCVVNRQ